MSLLSWVNEDAHGTSVPANSHAIETSWIKENGQATRAHFHCNCKRVTPSESSTVSLYLFSYNETTRKMFRRTRRYHDLQTSAHEQSASTPTTLSMMSSKISSGNTGGPMATILGLREERCLRRRMSLNIKMALITCQTERNVVHHIPDVAKLHCLP